jgi:hypothetical protein
MEDYYQWKMENDTSYYRSDENEPWFNCSDWSNRVTAKNENVNLVETSTSYSGKYIMDYLGITLIGTNLIDSDTFHVIKNEIREFYNYKISKSEFDNLCNKYLNENILLSRNSLICLEGEMPSSINKDILNK